jgi:hypothetical protein
MVKHGTLKTRIRTHVFTHLLAHEACVAIGGKGVKENPKRLPRPQNGVEKRHRQLMDGREIAHKGKARPNGQENPNRVLVPFFDQLLDGEIGVIQANPRGAVAFNFVFYPQKYFAVHRLRAGITAPQAPRHRSEQKQAQGGNDQQAREVNKVLRIQDQAEDVKTTRTQIKQHGLTCTPLQPRQTVKNELRQRDKKPAPIGKHTLH